MNGRKDKINSFTHTETFDICIWFTQVILKRIHKRVPSARNMQILFNKQAVYERGSRTDNGIFDEGKV